MTRWLEARIPKSRFRIIPSDWELPKKSRRSQKQIKDATGESVTELSIDLDSTGHLTDVELEQVSGGFAYSKIKGS